MPLFQQVAQQLIDGEYPGGALGSVNSETREELTLQIVARCLAVMTNTMTPPPTRSLLSCAVGETTLMMRVQHSIRAPSFVRQVLERQYPHIHRDSWHGFRMLKDGTGCCFDISSDKVDSIMK